MAADYPERPHDTARVHVTLASELAARLPGAPAHQVGITRLPLSTKAKKPRSGNIAVVRPIDRTVPAFLFGIPQHDLREVGVLFDARGSRVYGGLFGVAQVKPSFELIRHDEGSSTLCTKRSYFGVLG